MSKNFSDVNARSFPFLMSISTKPNSFAVFSDCPPAKATDFPSGEILLAPIRKGAGRDAHFLAFFRHYWILVKFLLTIGAITVLWGHTIFETVSTTVCVPLELGRKARCFIAFTYCGTSSRYIKS